MDKIYTHGKNHIKVLLLFALLFDVILCPLDYGFCHSALYRCYSPNVFNVQLLLFSFFTFWSLHELDPCFMVCNDEPPLQGSEILFCSFVL